MLKQNLTKLTLIYCFLLLWSRSIYLNRRINLTPFIFCTAIISFIFLYLSPFLSASMFFVSSTSVSLLLYRSRFTALFMLRWFYSAAEAGRCKSDCMCVDLHAFWVCILFTGSSVYVFLDMHVCVRVCRPFSILLSSLICFGSVWWAGHEANYLLKGKSEPNEPHWATEVTGLIKHSVCITGYLTQDPTVCWIFRGLHSLRSIYIPHIYGIEYLYAHKHRQLKMDRKSFSSRLIWLKDLLRFLSHSVQLTQNIDQKFRFSIHS